MNFAFVSKVKSHIKRVSQRECLYKVKLYVKFDRVILR